MEGMAASKSQRKQFIYINTGNQISAPWIFQKRTFQKHNSAQRSCPSRSPVQTVKGFPGQLFWSSSGCSSIVCIDRRQKQISRSQKGKEKVWYKKVPFLNHFSSFSSSFKSNLKCMDEVNYFIVRLSFWYLWCFLYFFIPSKINEDVSLCIRPEPFCLASVAFGTAFPGHLWGSYSGVLLKRFQCGPCPWVFQQGRKEAIRNQYNTNTYTELPWISTHLFSMMSLTGSGF